jgi:hypothetical protein
MRYAPVATGDVLILRSGRSPRLEGWAQRMVSRPSFETRAGRAPQDEDGAFVAGAQDEAVCLETPLTAETIIESLARFVMTRSAATKKSVLSFRGAMDCFASLAMTGHSADVSGQEPSL